MSEQEQNVEVIKRGYAAFAAGDVDTVMSLFDDNIEWIQPGESVISGSYHGKGELGQLFMRFAEKSLTTMPRRFLADGDMVVALTDVTVGDDRGHDADVFTLRDGKTVRVEVHTDTALMERVYGRKHVPAG